MSPAATSDNPRMVPVVGGVGATGRSQGAREPIRRIGRVCTDFSRMSLSQGRDPNSTSFTRVLSPVTGDISQTVFGRSSLPLPQLLPLVDFGLVSIRKKRAK